MWNSGKWNWHELFFILLHDSLPIRCVGTCLSETDSGKGHLHPNTTTALLPLTTGVFVLSSSQLSSMSTYYIAAGAHTWSYSTMELHVLRASGRWVERDQRGKKSLYKGEWVEDHYQWSRKTGRETARCTFRQRKYNGEGTIPGYVFSKTGLKTVLMNNSWSV